MDFCDGLCLLQKESYMRRGEICSGLDIRVGYLECSWGLFWFREMAAVDSLLEPVISAVADSCLALQFPTRISSFGVGLLGGCGMLPPLDTSATIAPLGISCHAGHCCGVAPIASKGTMHVTKQLKIKCPFIGLSGIEDQKHLTL